MELPEIVKYLVGDASWRFTNALNLYNSYNRYIKLLLQFRVSRGIFQNLEVNSESSPWLSWRVMIIYPHASNLSFEARTRHSVRNSKTGRLLIPPIFNGLWFCKKHSLQESILHCFVNTYFPFLASVSHKITNCRKTFRVSDICEFLTPSCQNL